MFEVEKNIPMPIKRLKYPFSLMEVGDSFFVGRIDSDPKYFYKKIHSYANHYRKRHGFKFAIRHMEKDGIKGVRVWRVE